MFCFVVMDWSTTTEFDIYKIHYVDKQKSGKDKICKHLAAETRNNLLVFSQ